MKRKRDVRETIDQLVSVTRAPKRLLAEPVDSEKCPRCGGQVVSARRAEELVCGGRWDKTWLPEEGKYRLDYVESCGWVPEKDVSNAPSYAVQYTWYKTTYSPMNHLLETFKRMDGTEQTEIPRNLLEAVKRELRRRYVAKEDITTDWVLLAMRYLTRFCNMDCRSYYENVEKILAEITGRHKRIFTEVQKERIKAMFAEYVEKFTQLPAAEKNGRCSLQEYSYLIYMISMICGFDNVLEHLSLIQGNDVLLEYNRLFKAVARECRWPLFQLSLSSIHRI